MDDQDDLKAVDDIAHARQRLNLLLLTRPSPAAEDIKQAASDVQVARDTAAELAEKATPEQRMMLYELVKKHLLGYPLSNQIDKPFSAN